MKNHIILIALLLLTGIGLTAQEMHQGINYQAVARTLDGEVIANQDMQLRITLISDISRNITAYTEVHQVRTSELGLFSLAIGHGSVINGEWKSIPWATSEMWLEVEMDIDNRGSFEPMGLSRLFAVPYAIHALTADAVTEKETRDPTPGGADSNEWSTKGNINTDPDADKLGTTDCADLRIVTNDKTRITIACRSQGQVTIQAPFVVARKKPTRLRGTLLVELESLFEDKVVIEGVTEIGDSLTVLNQAPTHLTGDLRVDGKSSFGGELNSDGPLNLKDSLNVWEDAPVYFSGKLGVDGQTNINNKLELVHESENFIATFENTDGETGDGIQIKLGKTHPRWMDNPPTGFSNQISAQIPGFTFLDAAVESTTDLVKGLMTSPDQTFNAANFEQIGLDLLDAFEDELGASFETYASLACNTTNDLIESLNAELGLPWATPDLTIPGFQIFPGENLFGGITWPDAPVLNDLPNIPSLDVPAIDFPQTNIPTGNLNFLTIDAIPTLDCPAPPTLSDWDLPNFRIENVPNSLTNANQYMRFVDMNDEELGSIRAQSIENWCDDYLSLTYFLNVFNSFAGVTDIGLDPTQVATMLAKYAINGITQIANVADAYNNIGVEYSSGFGDYAEWLERADHTEVIRPGDIVGVVGGKISKDLSNAEQVMAVSTKPIVLGNTPPEEREQDGNKVAFMGQIPVKVMGPVSTGDYIVGKGDVPGYGVAVHPSEMTIDDYSMAVGRSWEAYDTDGPVMVNTVVGVHNGNSLEILKQYQQKLDETDARLNSIEARLDQYFPEPNNPK